MKYKRKHVFALVLAITLIGIVVKFGVTMKKDNFQMHIDKENKLHGSGELLLREQNRNIGIGERWQNMLSFLTLDALNQCDRVFSPSLNIDYKAVMGPYLTLLEEHQKLIKEIKVKLNLSLCMVGYSANNAEETYIMLSLLRLPFVKTVCETGFNGGHSALLWLSQNPDVQVYSFDIGEMGCSKPVAEHLSQKYPGRLTITWGDSAETLPEFIRRNPDIKCDFLIIDGGHSYDVAKADRDNFRKMVRSNDNIVFLDNHPDIRYLRRGMGRIWEEAIRQGYIHELFRCHYPDYLPGFTFGKFVI